MTTSPALVTMNVEGVRVVFDERKVHLKKLLNAAARDCMEVVDMV